MANTVFRQHKRRLYTWTSPDGQYWNQIDYILCSQRWRISLQSAKTRLTVLMIWATVCFQSCFCWLYRASPSLAAKNIINLISVLTIWWCPCVEPSLVLLEEGVYCDQAIADYKICPQIPAILVGTVFATWFCCSSYQDRETASLTPSKSGWASLVAQW